MTKPRSIEENKLFRKGYQFIAGADEAGRGPWAGPLVAAAVVLPRRHGLRGINDSKKLSPQIREKLYVDIIKTALTWTVSVIDNTKIDEIGVGRANKISLEQAIQSLSILPDFALVDAFEIELNNIPSRSIVKGDAKVVSIAAASIIAKVTRDNLMLAYHKKFPDYDFYKHKGYGTKRHAMLLKKYGPISIHRKSFSPIKAYL